jgi:hypothetical protein
MECKLHVGQKVVCISVEDYIHHPALGDKKLEFGKQYTIRGIVPDVNKTVHINASPVPGVYLNEIVRAPWAYCEPAFYHWRFKPLEEREVDISVFTNILNSLPAQVLEDA